MIGSGSFLGTLSSSLFLSSVFFRVGALGAPLKPPGGLNFFKNGLWKGGSFNLGCSDLPRSKMLQTIFFFQKLVIFFILVIFHMQTNFRIWLLSAWVIVFITRKKWQGIETYIVSYYTLSWVHSSRNEKNSVGNFVFYWILKFFCKNHRFQLKTSWSSYLCRTGIFFWNKIERWGFHQQIENPM